MISKLKKIPVIIGAATLLACASAPSFSAGMPQIAAPFSAENAVIDTAIPFAIGSHQAEQALRGSFGWATFQEGKIDGIYYRFDPDGYARFSRSPRLDEEVFEVNCIARTLTCVARKNELTLSLTPSGALQMDIAGISPNDHMYLDDGFSQLELPARILQPLEARLENLFTEGGKIVIGRNGQETMRIALSGFEAVTAYLRWVASGQNHAILPRDWPVPYDLSRPINSRGSLHNGQDISARQLGWPKENSPAYNGQTLNGQNLQQPMAVQSLPVNGMETYMGQNPQPDPSLQEISNEISLLRQSLSDQNTQGMPTTYPENWRNSAQMAPQSEKSSSDVLFTKISRLELGIEALQDEMKRNRYGEEATLEEATEEMASEPVLGLADAGASEKMDESTMIAFFLNQPYAVEEVPLFKSVATPADPIVVLPNKPDPAPLEAVQSTQPSNGRIKIQATKPAPAPAQKIAQPQKSETKTKAKPAPVQKEVQPQKTVAMAQPLKPARVQQKAQPQRTTGISQAAVPARVQKQQQPGRSTTMVQAPKPVPEQKSAEPLRVQNSNTPLLPLDLLANLQSTEPATPELAAPAQNVATNEDPSHQAADFSEFLVAELLNDLSKPASAPTQAPIETVEALPMRNIILGAALPKLQYRADYVPLSDYMTMIMNLEQ